MTLAAAGVSGRIEAVTALSAIDPLPIVHGAVPILESSLPE